MAQRRLGEEDETMRYVFGDYSLDTQRYELRRAGDLIPLGPQVFNVLAYLVAHRDRVISRDELFADLWPDQFVTDGCPGSLHSGGPSRPGGPA
jgi:adenylate cyclase